MAKRAHQKLFSLDLESLLISDLSSERQNDSQTSTSESLKTPKKLKVKDQKASTIKLSTAESKDYSNEKNDGIEEVYDVTKFFENVGNDFSKSLQVRKSRLTQFTDALVSIYHSRITEMIKRQEAEVTELKEQTASNIQEELNRCEEEFKKLKQQETKLMKILEQQVKMLQKTTEAQIGWNHHFQKLHLDFVQAYEELKNKHKNETLDLKKSLTADASDLQNKFLVDSKKEEMQTMKKYLSSIYF